ncbi:MAG: inositol monophosphatase [Opitutaceae bacterium]
MSDSELAPRIAAGRVAVMAQTERLHQGFGRAQSDWKADGTRVTPVDIAISEGLFAELGNQFPADQFFSEELAHEGPPIPVTARYSWLLDPIDGTNNFALGIPHCAIALALLRDGDPVYGFVYDFARRQLIHGGPGHGVTDGERRPRLKSDTLNAQSVIGFHSPYDKGYAPHAAILADKFKIRGLGTSTMHLAYVGAGLFDGVVDHNVKAWDIAAAVPLVKAVGGEVAYVSPAPFPLREFDLNMGRTFYVAGAPAAVTELKQSLGVM